MNSLGTSAYSAEVAIQKGRLETIHLFADRAHPQSCPVCGSSPEVAPPEMVALQRSLEGLDQQLSGVESERPKLWAHIEGLEAQAASLRQIVRTKQRELLALEAEDAKAEAMREQNARAARVLGRVSLYLESAPPVEKTDEHARRLADFEARADQLRKALDEESAADRLESILNRIGVRMTALARRIRFEHSQYHLDSTFAISPLWLTVRVGHFQCKEWGALRTGSHVTSRQYSRSNFTFERRHGRCLPFLVYRSTKPGLFPFGQRVQAG